MFVRVILLLFVVLAVLWLLKRLFSGDEVDKIESQAARKPEDMLQCKYCGTHVPVSLIVKSNEQPYCCQDHADRDKS